MDSLLQVVITKRGFRPAGSNNPSTSIRLPEPSSRGIKSSPARSASRIAHNIDFPDYSSDELFTIAELIAASMNYRFDPDGVAAMREYIERRRRPNFANARSIRNALDRARLRQARRLCDQETGLVDREALRTIQAADIRASRIFFGRRA